MRVKLFPGVPTISMKSYLLICAASACVGLGCAIVQTEIEERQLKKYAQPTK